MDNFAELKIAVDGFTATTTEALQEQRKDLKELRTALEKAELRLNRPGFVGVPRDAAGSLETRAWTNYLRRGKEGMDDLVEIKSLQVSVDPQGGYLAPPEFVREVLKAVVEYSPIRQAARVGTTAAGSVLLPKRSVAPTAYWVAELETRTETSPSYSQLEVPVSEAACYIDVSLRLLEDSAIDVAGEIAADLSQELGRLEGAAFCNGDGIRKPLGFMQDANVGFVVNGHATAIQPDGLISLVYSLPAFYRNRGSLVMSGGTLAAARKLKDGQNNYLWQPSYQAGQPETLLGRPVIEAVDMPDVASGTFPVAFGDWATAYRIFDKPSSFTLLRDPFSQATRGLVRFHCRYRTGGQTVMPEAIAKLKMVVS